MTTITKERLLTIKQWRETYGPGSNVVLPAEEAEELARIALASLEAEPVSQTYNLPELIEGMEVSIDVSTCDADLGNRYFGTVTEASELDTSKNGYILLVQDAEPNFDVNGNYPVTPDGWISCSERMPDDGQHVIILCDGAFVLYAQYRDGEFFDVVRNGEEFFETQSRNVTHWMPLPEPPQGLTMANLQLAVNGEYFDQMKRGEKTEEYRLCNDYWNKRIMFREYDRLIITKGYPKRDDSSRRIDVPYGGYEIKTITHPHFGDKPVKVFAIKVNIGNE
ncbi:DUF551 domain-containing protein [Escherichia coli]|nr:DUF551 domain-containing protein [Escherichia coli]EIJ2789880.1 DUF551 domain-containing protein [Escherichia coli]EKR5524775.1 DUF551 domain-containing protein [Escherichia coli]HCP3083411.1 DUF551 domain-containing protein [Escherichia coli]